MKNISKMPIKISPDLTPEDVEKLKEQLSKLRMTNNQVILCPPSPMTVLQSAQRVVDTLNQLLEADPAAITALVDHRVECSEHLALNTEAMCGISGDIYLVGMVGIINALVAPEVIAAFYDGDKLTNFTVFSDQATEGGAA